MKEGLNYHDYELAVQDEEAPLTDPKLKTSRRGGDLDHIGKHGNKRAVFEDPSDASWLDRLTTKIEKSRKPVEEFDLFPAIGPLLYILRLPRSVEMGEFALAWLLDTLDPDIDKGEYKDLDDYNYTDTLKPKERYPRLIELAVKNPQSFKAFQSAINSNRVAAIGLPDLSRQT